MAEPRVYIVHLRRPNRSDPDEQRADPYWECGSFGCTGCHSKNLLHPRRAAELEGARFAFAQGGRSGFRLVYLTPPISIRQWDERLEARWKPAEMPFKYTEAPILAANGSASHFPALERFARATARPTIEGGFSSRFRSKAEPLESEIAKQLLHVYGQMRKSATADAIASRYEQALPHLPPCIDQHRRKSYRARIDMLDGRANGVQERKCRSGSKRKMPRSGRKC